MILTLFECLVDSFAKLWLRATLQQLMVWFLDVLGASWAHFFTKRKIKSWPKSKKIATFCWISLKNRSLGSTNPKNHSRLPFPRWKSDSRVGWPSRLFLRVALILEKCLSTHNMIGRLLKHFLCRLNHKHFTLKVLTFRPRLTKFHRNWRKIRKNMKKWSILNVFENKKWFWHFSSI